MVSLNKALRWDADLAKRARVVLESAQRKNLQETHSCLVGGVGFLFPRRPRRARLSGNERRSEAVGVWRGRRGRAGRYDVSEIKECRTTRESIA